jgi:hypothetical protein
MNRAALISGLVIAGLAAPSSASAFHEPEPHKCQSNGTRVVVDPADDERPVSYTHDVALLFACEPYGVYVTYVREDGSRDRVSYQAGDVEMEHSEPPRRPATAPTPAPPAEQRRPATRRKVRRSCRKSRRPAGRHARPRDRQAAERRERARRRAARRCKRRR